MTGEGITSATGQGSPKKGMPIDKRREERDEREREREKKKKKKKKRKKKKR